MSFLRLVLRLFLFGLLGALWLFAGTYLYLSPNLPDVETLRDVKLQTPMSVYTQDGELIGQFGEQKRSPLPFDAIPQQFINALLAAEDDSYFRHRGIDFMGLMRAVSELILTGEKGSGGSTLTMQVARNYFLNSDRTFIRKFNEILLAIEIERNLSKQEIFELYFNRVFLGHRAYGFEAASQVYYGSGIGELSLAQHAMLAGIPKAPSRNNPLSGAKASVERRNWILGRMQTLGYISNLQYRHELLLRRASHHGAPAEFHRSLRRGNGATGNAAASMVRPSTPMATVFIRRSTASYSTSRISLSPTDLLATTNGTVTAAPSNSFHPRPAMRTPSNHGALHCKRPHPLRDCFPPLSHRSKRKKSPCYWSTAATAELLWENGIRQARPYLSENATGAGPKSVAQVLAIGDLIRVTQEEGEWQLAQVPAAQAALVSLDPENGAIISLVGGLVFERSKFNRATQAQRQPGSNFKPFLYSAALASGFTAASIINDAPVVMEGGSPNDIWRPKNDEGKFYGPTRLRWALTKSRNLVSIRLLQQLGVKKLISYANELGFNTTEFVPELSLALGTQSLSPLDLATGYAVLANGGYRVEPFLIQRIESFEEETLYVAKPLTVCRDCEVIPAVPAAEEELSMEQIMAGEMLEQERFPPAPRVMEEGVNFIIDSILKDVITRGTGRRALVLERSDIGGKTGTTNGPMDVWFSGYNQKVVTTTWVGFDNYTPLGRREFGGTAALPIWIEYMRAALKDTPQLERQMPAGIVRVKIDPSTGQLARTGQRDAIFEYFRKDNVPRRSARDDGRHNDNRDANDQIYDIF